MASAKLLCREDVLQIHPRSLDRVPLIDDIRRLWQTSRSKLRCQSHGNSLTWFILFSQISTFSRMPQTARSSPHFKQLGEVLVQAGRSAVSVESCTHKGESSLCSSYAEIPARANSKFAPPSFVPALRNMLEHTRLEEAAPTSSWP